MTEDFIMAVPKRYEHINFKPPSGVAKEAEKGLKYRRKGGKGGLSSQEAGEKGIGSGVQRAVNLKNRNNLTPETIKMMRGFFARHEKNKSIAPKNKDTPWKDAGYVAWLLWGGDVGKRWVDKIIKQMETADTKEEEEKKKKKEEGKKLAQKFLAVKKKQVQNKDGETVEIYEYSDAEIKKRHKNKAENVEKVRKSIDKMMSQVKKDLQSKEKQEVALAVALIDETYERVGNDRSADNGHYGVTGWQKKHLSFKDDRVVITYTGKSGVKQEKTVTDKSVVKLLKDLCKDKNNTDCLLGNTTPQKVNDYLKDFGITAKDIRGYHANNEVLSNLKDIRSKGPKLPSDSKEREKLLKEEFKKGIELAAEVVGHEETTLRNQYLVPHLEDTYMKDGTIITSLKKGSFIRSVVSKHIQGKNVPNNEKLWEKVQKLTKGEIKSLTHNGKTVNGPNNGTGFTKFPSAYANGWASKVYKDMGGTWSTEKASSERVASMFLARGKAKKDVGNGGLDEWFSGHGQGKDKSEGDATWGDWVAISPIKKTITKDNGNEKTYEPGDIIGPCGELSDDPNWKKETNNGKSPFKCMPRNKAHDMKKKERAELAKAKQEAEKGSRGKKPVNTPTFKKDDKDKKARVLELTEKLTLSQEKELDKLVTLINRGYVEQAFIQANMLGLSKHLQEVLSKSNRLRRVALVRKIVREVRKVKALQSKSAVDVGYIDPKKFKVPSPKDLDEALNLMMEARNFNVESWTGSDCEEIARSILAVTKGKAQIWEIRAVNRDFDGIHFYVTYGGLYFNESEGYDEEDWGDLEHVKAVLKPSRLPNDWFGMEILYAVRLNQMGINSYTLEEFDAWYDRLY